MSTSLLAAPGAVDLSAIEHGYQVLDPAAVIQFVHEHPEVVSPLQAAPSAIQSLFGDHLGRSLYLLHDPESAGESPMLIVGIQTDLDVEDAWPRMDAFSDRWVRETIGDDAIPLHFVIEYW